MPKGALRWHAKLAINFALSGDRRHISVLFLSLVIRVYRVRLVLPLTRHTENYKTTTLLRNQ